MYIFLYVGKKIYWKGMKKGGEMHIFPQLVKSIHIFSPSDYLKYTKLQKRLNKISTIFFKQINNHVAQNTVYKK